MRLKVQAVTAEDKEIHEAESEGNARSMEGYWKGEAFQAQGDEWRDKIITV